MDKIENMNCIIAKQIMQWEEREMAGKKYYMMTESSQPFSYQLKFHCDWRWLMDAIQKIEQRCFKVTIEGDYSFGRKTKVIISGVGKFDSKNKKGDFACVIKSKFRTVSEIEKSGINPKMETIHEAVFQFANYYEQNKKQKIKI